MKLLSLRTRSVLGRWMWLSVCVLLSVGCRSRLELPSWLGGSRLSTGEEVRLAGGDPALAARLAAGAPGSAAPMAESAAPAGAGAPAAGAAAASGPAASGPAASGPAASGPAASGPAAGAAAASGPAASGLPMSSPPDADAVKVGLPRYDLNVRLDTTARLATVAQKVTFTNPVGRPAEELAFHVIPRFKIPPGSYKSFVRLAQAFRLNPDVLIDPQGRRLEIKAVRIAGKPIAFRWDERFDTILHVPLEKPLAKGESVTAELDWELDVPPFQGRCGQYNGVTSLQYWYPLLCHYSVIGWTTQPYIPWHQPYFHEMGVYNVRLSLPADQVVGASGQVLSEEPAVGGFKTLVMAAEARDFCIAASNRYKVMESEVDGIKLRVLAFESHQRYARFALSVLEDCVPQYNAWFGKYPHPKLEVVETYFGYNGNESSGVVMIDQRVMAQPFAAFRYFDQLLGHETMHQWWYNTVGTNGFTETWMDEGLVNHLTNWRMRQRYGFNVPLFDWPAQLSILPNIDSEDLTWKGYYRRLLLEQDGPCVQSLPEFGRLDVLFDLAYDKGGRVMGMIHRRLGDEEFFVFLRRVYAKYSKRILTVAAFRAELEAHTGRSWESFFKQWVYGVGICDWSMEEFSFSPAADPAKRLVRMTIRQKGQIAEPTDINVKLVDRAAPVRVRLDPERGAEYALPEVAGTVRSREPNVWQIELLTDADPGGAEIDAEYRVLDVFRNNNRTGLGIDVRFLPLYLTADDNAFFVPFNKPRFQFGVYAENTLPENNGVGFKAGINQAYQYSVYGLIGFVPDTREVVAGGVAEYYALPIPNTTVGIEYIHSLRAEFSDRQMNRGRVFARYSTYRFPNIAQQETEFVEVYGRLVNQSRDNEGVTAPGVDPLINRAAFGVTFRQDTRVPYWDPHTGTVVHFNYENGGTLLGVNQSYQAFTGELAFVERLPDGLGYFSKTKIAGRAAGGFGAPSRAQIFQFGGSDRFRGLYPTSRQGNAFWLLSAEYRFPILSDLEMELPFVDNLGTLRGVGGAIFYDIGDIYQLNRSADLQKGGGSEFSRGGISHGLGFGLRFDISLLSYLERSTFRIDAAKDLSSNERWTIWASLRQPF